MGDLLHAKRSSVVVAGLLACMQAIAADGAPTACDIAATQQPGALKQESNTPSGDKALGQDVSRRADRLIDLLREATPGSKGFDARYSRGIDAKPFVKDGPQKYGVRVLFYHYICERASDRATRRPVETGRFKLNDGDLKSILEIVANYPGTLNASVYGGGYPAFNLFERVDRMRIGDSVRNVYFTQPMIGRWKGFAAYGNGFLEDELSAGDPFTRGHVGVLVWRKDEQPFVSLTRRQCVLALLDDLDAKHLEQVQSVEHAREPNPRYRETIDSEHAQRRAWLEQQLNAPAVELDRPALFKGGAINTSGVHIGGGQLRFSGTLFSDQEVGSSAVLIANRAYWRTTQARNAPQLFTLTFAYDRRDVGSATLARSLRDNFPIDKLQALLDR